MRVVSKKDAVHRILARQNLSNELWPSDIKLKEFYFSLIRVQESLSLVPYNVVHVSVKQVSKVGRM